MSGQSGELLRVARVGPPQSPPDLDQAYDLFARAFPPSYFEARSFFDFLRANEPPVPAGNHLLAWMADDTLAGAIRVVDRTCLIDQVEFSTAGLSFYAVAAEYQTSDCAPRLIEALFAFVQAGGYDLSMGVARKVMDGYWSRFGYIGFGGFHTLTTSSKALRSVGASSGIALELVEAGKHVDLASLHAATYSSLSGAFVRDPVYWRWWNSRLRRRRDLSLSVFTAADEIVGYVAQHGATVIEMAARHERLANCLAAMGRSTSRDVVFNLPPNHPAAVLLHRTNHSASSRRAWNGAFIAKVTDRDRFLSKMHQRLQHRLLSHFVGPFRLQCNDVAFGWDGRSLSVGSAAAATEAMRVTFDPKEWPKLLLGLAEPHELRGFISAGGAGIINVLFPRLFPQMGELDEF